MRDLRKDFMKYYGEEDSFAVLHLSPYKPMYSIVENGVTLVCDSEGYITNVRIAEEITINEIMYVAMSNNIHFDMVEQLPTYKLRLPNDFKGVLIHLKTNKTFYIT